jgi:3-oxoacyl-[acyl-carrier-protein] synthase-3
MKRSVITGVGSYIPSDIKSNRDFTVNNFYNETHHRSIPHPWKIVDKFKAITGIEERRYAAPDLTSSGMAIIAARHAIEDSGIDPETLDQIILAHNFG